MIDELTDGSIVEEAMSQYGLHRLHVMRMGGEVDIQKWIGEKVQGGEVVTWLMYEDEELEMHHLRLWWRDNTSPRDETARPFSGWMEGKVVPHVNGGDDAR